MDPSDGMELSLSLGLDVIHGLGSLCPLEETESLEEPVAVCMVLDQVLLDREPMTQLATVLQIGLGPVHQRCG